VVLDIPHLHARSQTPWHPVMPPTLLPEVLLRGEDAGQTELALAAEGVLRVVWDGRFGTMLIEVVGGEVFVNGQQVLPAAPRCS
jgi:hypothetical protein